MQCMHETDHPGGWPFGLWAPSILIAPVEALPPADILPPELTAIRAVGLVLAAAIAGFALWRRRSLRNMDVLILVLVALGLALVSGTELLDSLFAAFSFEENNNTRIIGVAVFAIVILFLLVVRALAQGSRITRELSGVLEGLAWEEFRIAGHPDSFRDRIAVVVPAYNEADSVGQVLDRIPTEVCGVPTAVLVVDDGSRDATGDIARQHGAVVARHVINRGGGAALRTGYRLMAASGATIVVTLDADGQHLPSEMERLV
jgi:Glycosyl transferase family 2